MHLASVEGFVFRDSGSGPAFKIQNITVAGTSGLTVFPASNHAGLDWNLR